VMDIVKKLDYGFQLFCAYLLALSVSLLLAIIVLREFFGISYDFLVDTTVWLTIWSMLLLSGPLFGEGGHIAIKALLQRIPGKFGLTVEFLNALCTLVFVTIVTYGGVLLIHTLYSQHQVYPRYIAIPMWMVQICVPIGLLLLAVYAIAQLYRIVQRMRA